jgi:hypothetical protein
MVRRRGLQVKGRKYHAKIDMVRGFTCSQCLGYAFFQAFPVQDNIGCPWVTCENLTLADGETGWGGYFHGIFEHFDLGHREERVVMM